MAIGLNCLNDFLAWLFIYSGFSKLASISVFRNQVVATRFLPLRISAALAYLLPAVEVLIGISLLIRICDRMPLVLTIILLSAFTGFVAWILISKTRISCFCFGEEETVVSRITLLRNVFILALAGVALALNYKVKGTISSLDRILSIGYGLSFFAIFLAGVQLASRQYSIENAQS